MMVRCTLSPDAQFLVSGSETGQPYIWDIDLCEMIDAKPYQASFHDIISDCDWNPRYNMFAVCGFGQEFPILVYVHERERKEVEDLIMKYGKLQANQINDEFLDLDNDLGDEVVKTIAKKSEKYDEYQMDMDLRKRRKQNRTISDFDRQSGIAEENESHDGRNSDYNLSQSHHSRVRH